MTAAAGSVTTMGERPGSVGGDGAPGVIADRACAIRNCVATFFAALWRSIAYMYVRLELQAFALLPARKQYGHFDTRGKRTRDNSRHKFSNAVH